MAGSTASVYAQPTTGVIYAASRYSHAVPRHEWSKVEQLPTMVGKK
jgi:hypothetical protein